MNHRQLRLFTASALSLSAVIVHASFVYSFRDDHIVFATKNELDALEDTPIQQKASPSDLEVFASAAADLCSVSKHKFFELIQAESGWNPWALSPVGAIGLTQVMPRTAKEFDPSLNLWDPWQNLLAGACILRQHYDRHRLKHSDEHSWRLALYDYHAGPYRKRTSGQTVSYADGILSAAASQE